MSRPERLRQQVSEQVFAYVGDQVGDLLPDPRRGAARRRAARAADRQRLAVERGRRRAARALRSAQRWAAVAAASPVVAVTTDHWLWLVPGGAAAAKAALSWRVSRVEHAQVAAASSELPVSGAVPPPAGSRPRVPRTSAAYEYAARGEASLDALYGLVEHLPTGPLADEGRFAVSAAVSAVSDLRLRAARVVACETAARAVADPDRRAQVEAGVPPLLGELSALVDGLDGLVAATSDAVTAVPGGSLTGLRLAESVDAVRALAASLRELA